MLHKQSLWQKMIDMQSGSFTRPNSPSAFKAGRCSRRSAIRPTCDTVRDEVQCRRGVLEGSAAVLAALIFPKQALSAAKAQNANVGSYLPKAGDGFVQFKPNETQTPSIRAGVIKSSDAYKFILPDSWSEQRIANIQSGNFCMPRCDEPWQEVIYADPAEGKVTLTVMNTRRLTNKGGAKIEQIGQPTNLLQSLGPYITGTILDEEELVSADKVDKEGRTYYSYEANSLSGNSGPHYVAVATTKGELLYLFTIAASEPQWKKSKAKLKKVAESFQV